MILVKNTIEFLKTREDGLATYEDVRSHLGLDNSVKKLFKTQEFQRFMEGDVRVPYRTVFPEAEESEWKRKGTPQVEIFCLIIVTLNILTSLFSGKDCKGCQANGSRCPARCSVQDW